MGHKGGATIANAAIAGANTTTTTAATNSASRMKTPEVQMITEAISSLKDQTGSSQLAIAKFIDEKVWNGASPKFKKVLSVQLKKFAQSERLVKVKTSYKICHREAQTG
ncbi:histone H1-like [Telopea speciosissima]|uniref:histone H1-like n=1 Tax=Telopea speciosissima TaxID=54955 RepID=UPI001CC382FD|nr:histone H1-like [Telopea speciosissima]